MEEFLNVWSTYITPIIVVIVAVQMVIYHRIGSRIEAQFRDASSTNVRFRESGASGRRKKPFTFGSASRVLDVTVTDQELCIKGRWPIFTAFGRRFGLTHRVPLTGIRGIAQRGRRAEVSFTDEEGRECVLELELENAVGFKEAASRVA